MREDVRVDVPLAAARERVQRQFPGDVLGLQPRHEDVPDERSLAMLRDRGVDRVILHQRDFPDPETYRTMIAGIARRPGIREVSRASANSGEARLYD